MCLDAKGSLVSNTSIHTGGFEIGVEELLAVDITLHSGALAAGVSCRVGSAAECAVAVIVGAGVWLC